MVAAGLDPTYVGHEAFVERISSEEARYDRILQKTGIRIEH
jgi:hypothetical protein